MNFNKIKVNWLPRCATNTAFCHHKIRMLHTFGSLIITNITPSWEIVGVGRCLLFILVKILVKYLNFDPKTHGGIQEMAAPALISGVLHDWSLDPVEIFSF